MTKLGHWREEEEEPATEPSHRRGRVPTGGSVWGIGKLLEVPR
jgi:hypothetical protein